MCDNICWDERSTVYVTFKILIMYYIQVIVLNLEKQMLVLALTAILKL